MSAADIITARALELLTNSRVKAFKLCARLHHYEYELGYRPVKDADELAFGTLVHLALEAWWNAKKAGLDTETWLIKAFEALRTKPGVDDYDLVRADVMIAGYHTRWCDEQLEVLGVELKFETELINPESGRASRTWQLAGKLDVLVRKPDGTIWIVEHKTSSAALEAGSTYWQQLRMDSQVSCYFLGAKSLGHDVAGCLYDVLAKPAQRPLKATPVESRKFKANGVLYANQREHDETPEEYRARLVEAVSSEPGRYFIRGEVVRLEEELREFHLEVWQQAKTIHEMRRLNFAPRTNSSCFAYGRACAFWDVCTKSASLEDPARFRLLKDRHPELGGADASAA